MADLVHPDPRPPAADGERDLPEEIASAIEALAFASYSHGLGVGDGSLSQMEPRRSAEARSALTTSILSRLTAAEAGREEAVAERDEDRARHEVWQDNWRESYRQVQEAWRGEIEDHNAALARVEKLEKALPYISGHLRHAYGHLVNGRVTDLRSFADGLLAPQIRQLEALAGPALTEAQPKGDQ
jgi:hypothetical protein